MTPPTARPRTGARPLLCVFDLGARIATLNDAGQQLFGWRRASLAEIEERELVHRQDLGTVRGAVSGCLEGRAPGPVAVRCRLEGGGYREIAWWAAVDGTRVHAVGQEVATAEDHEPPPTRPMARSPAGPHETKILDALPMLVAACDASGAIVSVNESWREAADRNGLTLPDHGIGANYLEVCRRAIELDPAVRKTLDGLEAVLAGRSGWFSTEYELPIPDASRWFRVDVTPAPDLEGGGVVLLHTETTERRALEAQLRHAQKMEAMGAVAGGVAHDFNNLLQAIGGFAKLAMRAVAGTEAGEDLQQVLAASERASRLVRQLLTLSRRGESRSEEAVDLVQLVRELEKMLGRLLGPHVTLRTELPAEIPRVVGDPGQLEQVLMNLCLNSRDSIESRGTVTLTVDEVELAPSDVEGREWAHPGPHIRIRIRDDGCGIAPEHLDQLFEPFFTTKGESGGTGLGLPIVWGIVRQHAGTIDVSSEPGLGTTTVVHLPVAPGSRQAAETTTRPRSVADGHGRLLVAEDDPAVQRFLVRVLEAAGYELSVASDGTRAIELFDRDPEAIDLAVLDAVMPGANGREVFEHLRARRPALPVVFLSGYSFDVLGGGYSPSDDVPLLGKPCDPGELLEVLKAVLAGTWTASGRT